MPLPQILNIAPDEQGWNTFFFDHARDHDEIRAAVQKLKGINLPQYVLEPVDRKNFQTFLERHQQAHNDMLGVTGVNGSDLTGLDPDKPAELQAWLFLNWTEHSNVRQVLAI